MVNRSGSLALTLTMTLAAASATAQGLGFLPGVEDPIFAHAGYRSLVDGFGTEPQVAILSPFDLAPDNMSTTLRYRTGGYRYLETDAGGYLKIGLSPGTDLPVGARVMAACLQVVDFRDDGEIELAMWAFEQPTVPGTEPYVDLISDWQGSGIAWSSGYIPVCVLPDVTLSTFGDLNSDATSGRISYAFGVDFTGPTGTSLAVGSISILWTRQISPAPVAATFSDVPVGAFGFQHVEALVASGITAGCGGGMFCPEAPLTRAQMAVFLAKALGLHHPN